MPRKSEMYLPGVPHHIIQCGNNREATFFSGSLDRVKGSDPFLPF